MDASDELKAVGDWYLNVLHRTGEFVPPRAERELRELFEQEINYDVKGNLAFVTTKIPTQNTKSDLSFLPES